MCTIGAPVAATADNAPPPRAVPSSLVITIPVTPANEWNDAATGPAALTDLRIDDQPSFTCSGNR